MKRSMTYRIVFVLVAAFTVACNDPIAPVGPDNRPELTNQPDFFQYKAWDLQNVHDKLQWTWTNTQGVATITHNSFVPHGDTMLSVRDAAGVEVYHSPLASPEHGPMAHATHPTGQPGAWTITLQFYGADGARIEFKLDHSEVEPAE